MIDNITTGIELSNLDYDTYALTQDGSFSEAYKFTSIEFNRIYTSKVRLPDGKSNIIYLLSDTFDKTVDLLNHNSISIPPTYRKVYYPIVKQGTFLNRRYRMNFLKAKVERDAFIKTQTNRKRIAYPSRTISATSTDNLFFITSDLYNVVSPVMKNVSINKLMKTFFNDFIDILQSMTPANQEAKGPEFSNRILIVDADAFRFSGGSLTENKTNLLFLLYLSFLRTRDNSATGADIDIVILSKNLLMKFNPARINPNKFNKFRTALFRIMKTNLDDYTATLTEDEQKELTISSDDIITKNIVDKKVDVYTKYSSPAVRTALASAIDSELRSKHMQSMAREDITKSTQNEISTGKKMTGKDYDNINHSIEYKMSKTVVNDLSRTPKTVKDSQDTRKRDLFKSVIGGGYEPLVSEEEIDMGAVEDDIIGKQDPAELDDYIDNVSDEIDNIILNDKSIAEDIIDEIQTRTIPMGSKRNSPVNGPLDEKLREQQKKVVVRDSTIEEILSRENSAIPVQTDDKSASFKSLNPNVKTITFANFDKTYIEELYSADLVAVFNSLQDKSTPFYITSIDITDASTALDLKETWKVHLKDETGKSHTITVDIPKFYQNKFLWLGGNKKMIMKQNLYNPIVKDTADSVIITTNYNKVTVTRRATKSFAQIENLFSLVKKVDDVEMFIAGDASKINMKYISTLEYDEIGKSLFKFKSGDCELFFNREYINNNINTTETIGNNEFIIGFEGKTPVIIHEDTGKDRNNRTIIEVIYQNLSDEHKAIFDSTKARKQAMYAEGKLLGQFVPVIVTLIVWNGITKTLDAMDIQWQFHKDVKRLPKMNFNMSYIKFEDGILEYESNLFTQLILNGLNKLGPEHLTFESLNDESGYIEYLHSIFGTYTIVTQFRTFYEFLVDPVTKDICRDMFLPQTPEGLMIHSVKLLANNAYINKASDKSYRIRSVEIIPAILYNKIAAQYTKYVTSGRRIPFSLPKETVIKELLAVNTVEDYSTLNPAIEIGKSYGISARGYKGSNTDRSYDEEKRSYDESSIGKLAMSSPNDANIGITRELVVEPTITNARGCRAPVEDLDDLKDVNIFSPVELLTPGTVRMDDPIRTAIAGKQTRHLVPVANASPALISNGFDEAIQFHLSSDFVVNAEEDGEVVEVNEEVGFIIVKYKSGNTQAININPEIVKNGGGGFYLSNTLRATVKLHDKFKKDDVLAYHDKYFKFSKNNGLRFAIGPLVKCAFISTYNTYEDAGICTEKLADMMKTSIVYKEVGTFKRNSNVINMVNVGDHVNIGDSLIKYDTSFDDTEISKLMAHLSDENKELIEETSKNDVITQHAGKVVDIKIFTLHDPSNLSPTLGDVVKKYFDVGLSRKELLTKYDSSEGIIKAGYLLTETIEPVVSRYNDIKGIKTDVLIEFYIEHGDVAGIGDKIVLYGPNKQIISEVIPKGYEPYSELHPDEEISVFTSPGTIARRMTSSIIPISMGMKIMVELKRKIKDIIKYK
jgi:hypothetical protein